MPTTTQHEDTNQTSTSTSTGTQTQVGTQTGTSSQTGTQTGNQTQTGVNTPWEFLMPWIQRLLTNSTTALEMTPGTGSNTYFTDPLYAGPNENQQRAVQMLLDFAPQAGQGADAVRQLGLDTVAGKYLSHESNPYLSGAVDAALNQTARQFNRQILPGLGDAAQQAGAYGGDRQGIATGVAASDWQRDAGDLATNIYFQNYSQERNRQMQGAGLLDAANALGIQPALLTMQAGTTQQGWDQAQLDANRQGWLNRQQDPWVGLQQYMGMIAPFLNFGQNTTTGTSSQTGTQTGNTTGTSNQTGTSNVNQTGTQSTITDATATVPKGGSTAGGIFGGALGGASAGAAFGPWGAGIGAVLGGLGSLFD
jgi:hypothetical protein